MGRTSTSLPLSLLLPTSSRTPARLRSLPGPTRSKPPPTRSSPPTTRTGTTSAVRRWPATCTCAVTRSGSFPQGVRRFEGQRVRPVPLPRGQRKHHPQVPPVPRTGQDGQEIRLQRTRHHSHWTSGYGPCRCHCCQGRRRSRSCYPTISNKLTLAPCVSTFLS